MNADNHCTHKMLGLKANLHFEVVQNFNEFVDRDEGVAIAFVRDNGMHSQASLEAVVRRLTTKFVTNFKITSNCQICGGKQARLSAVLILPSLEAVSTEVCAVCLPKLRLHVDMIEQFVLTRAQDLLA